MKKIRLIVASILVTTALVSVPVAAGPTVKKPPMAEETVEFSLSTWFSNLLDF